MNTTLLILAGGASSRMKKSIAVDGLTASEIQAANTQSKALIGYGQNNRPILDALLMNAEKAGYLDVYLIVGKDHQAFTAFFGNERTNNPFNGLHISYVIQHIPNGRVKPFGTADAVAQALEQYPELQSQTFTVCNCDNLYSIAALEALKKTPILNGFIAYDRDGLDFPADRIARFALVQLDARNNVTDIKEKPTEDRFDSYRDAAGKLRVSMNIFKFHGTDMFPYLMACPPHPDRDEKELPTAILNFCKDHPGEFKGLLFNEHVPDLTSKEDIQTFKKHLE